MTSFSSFAASPVINRFDTSLSDLVVLDTKDFKPVATVKLPLRVRQGLHGNFVEHSTMLEPDRELVDFEWVPSRVSLCLVLTGTALLLMLLMYKVRWACSRRDHRSKDPVPRWTYSYGWVCR